MNRIVSVVARILAYGLAALLALLVTLTVWQVFARYVLGQPDPYSEEVIRVLLVWLGLLAGAYCVHRRSHVGFSTLVDRLSTDQQVWLDRLTRGLVAGFAGLVLVFGGTQLVALTVTLDQTTPALGLPVGITYAAIPLAGVLVVLFSIWPSSAADPQQGDTV